MARRGGCRRNGGRAAGCMVQEDERAAVRAEEEMPMCRHVNSIGRSTDCCCMERQLCLISQILDEQNRMLAQILREIGEQR